MLPSTTKINSGFLSSHSLRSLWLLCFVREWGHSTPAPTFHARQSASFPLPHYNRADAGPVLVYRTDILPHVRTSRDFSGFVHSMCLYNLSLSLIGYDYIHVSLSISSLYSQVVHLRSSV